jgi:uncharacterized protein YdeI (YjbR/CyaY-like superfamily)
VREFSRSRGRGLTQRPLPKPSFSRPQRLAGRGDAGVVLARPRADSSCRRSGGVGSFVLRLPSWEGNPATSLMAPIIPDPKKIRSFRSSAAFERWLSRQHAKETELWLRIFKKASKLPTVSYAEALDVALCWGWIDGLRKGFDDVSFLQRFTPRKAKSVWSQVNREHIARLTAAGRMTPHGQRHVDAAKADGRWENAYAPMRETSHETVPEDLRAAITANPAAARAFATLSRQNLFALTAQTATLKTAAARARKIAFLVSLLARGETLVPQSPKPGRAATPKLASRAAAKPRSASEKGKPKATPKPKDRHR